jgi:metal-dependent amidase/aminoacylase/carboxypeptidase family protein
LARQSEPGRKNKKLQLFIFRHALEEFPGAFYFLGLNSGKPGSYPVLHNSDFDFNDAALGVGIRMHSELALGFS